MSAYQLIEIIDQLVKKNPRCRSAYMIIEDPLLLTLCNELHYKPIYFLKQQGEMIQLNIQKLEEVKSSLQEKGQKELV